MSRRGWTRRRLLRVGSGVALGGVAGCLRFQSSSAGEGETPSPTENGTAAGAVGTDTPTPEVSPAVRQFHNDAANTGFDPDVTGPYDRRAEEAWTLDDADGSPAVVGDRLYVTTGIYVVAADRSDGSVLWERRVETATPGPAVFDGTVYVAGRNDALYALDAESGDTQWTTGLTGDPSTPTVDDGTIYLGTFSDVSDMRQVLALSADDGSEEWAYDIGNGVNVEGAPAVADGTVYVRASVDDQANVYALTADAGNVIWSESTGVGAANAPVVADGLVFVGGEQLHAYDAASGEAQWTADIVATETTPAVARGTVFAGGDGEVAAYDAATGERQWRYEHDFLDVVTGSPVVAGDTVYFADEGGLTVALATDDGSERFVWGVAGRVNGSLVAADGTLFIGDGAKLTAYRAQ